MGVTAHFFAVDLELCPGVPSIDRLVEWGALDRSLEVQGVAKAWLDEVPSILGDNKKWTCNIAGDHAWSVARRHVEPSSRAELDRWFSHLFWDAEDADDGGRAACSCGLSPRGVADDELLYNAALIEHILALEVSLDPVEAALAYEFAGEPPRSPRFDRPWIYDMDGFSWLISAWRELMERTRRCGEGRSLLRWVWV